jgi:hypothetical protein
MEPQGVPKELGLSRDQQQSQRLGQSAFLDQAAECIGPTRCVISEIDAFCHPDQASAQRLRARVNRLAERADDVPVGRRNGLVVDEALEEPMLGDHVRDGLGLKDLGDDVDLALDPVNGVLDALDRCTKADRRNGELERRQLSARLRDLGEAQLIGDPASLPHEGVEGAGAIRDCSQLLHERHALGRQHHDGAGERAERGDRRCASGHVRQVLGGHGDGLLCGRRHPQHAVEVARDLSLLSEDRHAGAVANDQHAVVRLPEIFTCHGSNVATAVRRVQVLWNLERSSTSGRRNASTKRPVCGQPRSVGPCR